MHPAHYVIENADQLLTPALAIYPDIVDANIAATLRLMNGDPNRWRPHVKTAKLGFIMRRLVDHGIRHAKCSTSLELIAACEAGLEDVLFAYPLVGAGVNRLRALAERYSSVRISALVEDVDRLPVWSGSRVGLFLDLNPGMNRTGIDTLRQDQVASMLETIQNLGIEFRGFHYYDGHHTQMDLFEREAAAHKGYDELLRLVTATRSEPEEIITSGTPAFPCALSYPGFKRMPFTHRVSPGTVVYCDTTTFSALPAEYGYQPAVLVVASVVSRPRENVITCNAGHKAVSADAGVPTCHVLGRPDLVPQKPSEEHLPILANDQSTVPNIGETLYLIPRHVCPTVNNFDDALLVRDGRIERQEKVTARGHEPALAVP